jgi:hypothetical protein
MGWLTMFWAKRVKRRFNTTSRPLADAETACVMHLHLFAG